MFGFPSFRFLWIRVSKPYVTSINSPRKYVGRWHTECKETPVDGWGLAWVSVQCVIYGLFTLKVRTPEREIPYQHLAPYGAITYLSSSWNTALRTYTWAHTLMLNKLRVRWKTDASLPLRPRQNHTDPGPRRFYWGHPDERPNFRWAADQICLNSSAQFQGRDASCSFEAKTSLQHTFKEAFFPAHTCPWNLHISAHSPGALKVLKLMLTSTKWMTVGQFFSPFLGLNT